MSQAYLDVIFRSIKEEFDKRYNITDPDDTDPDTIAFQKAVHALNCPVTALIVRLPKKISYWGGIECEMVSYVRLDLESPSSPSWNFLGEYKSDEFLANPNLAKALL